MSKEDCLLCRGGNIGMNPQALDELRVWHYAGHPKRHTQVTGLRLEDSSQDEDTVTSQQGSTIEDKLPSIHANEINGLDCPSCGHPTLMVMAGGYITCCLLDCPNPDYADAIQKLITTETTKARIDELEHMNTHRHYGMDYQDSMDELAEYKETRLAELTDMVATGLSQTGATQSRPESLQKEQNT